MHEEDLEVAIKVVVVGNGAVGKSSMIQRYCKGVFTKDYKKTIGVDFLEKQTRVGKDDVRLMVWDTAGQEEFDAITKAYYRGAQVCVLAFSTVDRDSFLAIESWKKKVEDEVGDIVMTIVQNKIDLIDEAVMTPDEVDALAKRLKLKLFRASVKEGFNVDQVFDYLAVKYLDRRRKLEEESKPKTTSIGVFSSESYGNSTASSGPIQSSTSGSGGEGFQIKPSKQRAKKKTTLCSFL
ncbi:hypothetical protein EMCRGX_G034151 [Ephydatia muelleri]